MRPCKLKSDIGQDPRSATSELMHCSRERAADHRSFWVDATVWISVGTKAVHRLRLQKLHQSQSTAIRMEAALAAEASGRMPAPYPVADG